MSSQPDPRISRTRNLIQDAFLALWATKPLQKISVRDITQHAGINRATFYSHFQDKYDLCDKVIAATFESFLVEQLPKNAPLNKTNFKHLVAATMHYVVDFRRDLVTDNDFDNYIETRVQRILLDRIMTWIKPDYLINGCEVGEKVAATALSWAIFGTAVGVAEQKNPAGLVDPAAEELVNMLAMGLWQSLARFQPTLMQSEEHAA